MAHHEPGKDLICQKAITLSLYHSPVEVGALVQTQRPRTWRPVDGMGHEQIPLVMAGEKFIDGELDAPGLTESEQQASDPC